MAKLVPHEMVPAKSALASSPTATKASSQATEAPAPVVPPLLQYGGPYAAAIAAVLAATVAGVVALRGIKAARDNLIMQMDMQREIAAKASRANVVSANRQKWIDALREDLAAFIAADFVLLDDADADEGNLLSDAETIRQRGRVDEAKTTRRLMQRRIQLRLNPEKEKHQELYRAVMDLIPATGTAHRRARKHLVETAQAFLRREWLRVKSEAGEWEAINTSGPSHSVQDG